MSEAPRFRLLAHTADIGLEATAASREELFVTVARGMKTMMFGESPVGGTLRQKVVVEAGDPAELLVAWLNEIVYLCESGSCVPADFRIERLGDRHLTAIVSGEPFDPARHTVERVAKAVTYHGLTVEERKDGWFARVYIDL